jgi:hypothetical protein
MADQLAKLEAECQLIGLEPACGVSEGIVKKAVRDWTNRDHQKSWESLTGLKQQRDSYKDPLSDEPRNC